MIGSPWIPDAHRPFRWREGERTIVFGRGAVDAAADLLGEGFTLLSTPRARDAVPGLADRAATVLDVRPGLVDEIAGELRGTVQGGRIVALGGGRVIDTAKALAAADPPMHVVAIPTTLSGAEMTPVHRHATGVPMDTPRVRPAVVITDPGIAGTQPARELAESAANALGHAVEGPLTPLGNPGAELGALAAAVLLRDGSAGSEPDRDALTLGALLAGWVIGSTHYGLHHVMSQTLVRFAQLGHGQANAIMLPVSIGALSVRGATNHAWFVRLEAALGEPAGELAERLRELTTAGSLSDAGVTSGTIERLVGEAAGRPELHLTPPAASAEELRELYQRAL